MWTHRLAESGLVPDAMIRAGIRRMLRRRIADLSNTGDGRAQSVEEFAERLRRSPIAVATTQANEQHYEVPVDFFQSVLGPRLKYSSCWFESPRATLAEAELDMLRRTIDRAEIADGMRILELGCGWGSLTLWLAANYPRCRITAVSNSTSQREFIERRARRLNLPNIEVITADMREFQTGHEFDRVISIEMFEHLRNYEEAFERVSQWLRPGGKAFVHIFCHRSKPYLFDCDGPGDWMGRNFFTGGTMPSADLFAHFDRHLVIDRQWSVNGVHYARTCEAWLNNADRNRKRILGRFQRDMSPRQSVITLQRWRMFFMACAELFRFDHGTQWFVAHYLFERSQSRVTRPSPRMLQTT